jgi:hypothetical protein
MGSSASIPVSTTALSGDFATKTTRGGGGFVFVVVSLQLNMNMKRATKNVKINVFINILYN